MPRSASANRFYLRDIPAAINAGTGIITASSALMNAAGGATAAMTVIFRGIAAGGAIAQFSDDSANNSWRVNIETGTNKLFTWHETSGGVGTLGYKTSTSVKMKTKMRLVITYDAATNASEIWLDGVSIGSAVGSAIRTSTKFAVFPNNNSGQTFSNVRVWQRKLTSAEIIADTFQNDVASGCVLDWPFTEGAGTAVTDISGSGLNATITTPTWRRDTRTRLRLPYNGGLIRNAGFEYQPPFTAAQTSAGAWLDGTLTGNATNSNFGFAIPTAGITAGANARFDPTVSRSGNGSLKLSTLDATGVIVVTQSISASGPSSVTDALTPLLPSTQYTISCWVKTDNVAANAAYIDFREFGGPVTALVTAATNSSPKLSGTNVDFTLLTFTVTTQANTRFGEILFRNFVAGNIGAAWFEDPDVVPVTPFVRTQADVRSASA